MLIGSLILTISLLQFKETENSTNKSNGVEHKQVFMEKLPKSPPRYFPTEELLNKTVYFFVDLNQISDVN